MNNRKNGKHSKVRGLAKLNKGRPLDKKLTNKSLEANSTCGNGDNDTNYKISSSTHKHKGKHHIFLLSSRNPT